MNSLLLVLLFICINWSISDVLFYYAMGGALATEWSTTTPNKIITYASGQNNCPGYNLEGRDYCWRIDDDADLIRTAINTTNYYNLQLIYSVNPRGISASDHCYLYYTVDGNTENYLEIYHWQNGDEDEAVDVVFNGWDNALVDNNNVGIKFAIISISGAHETYFNEMRLEGDFIISTNPTPLPTIHPSQSPITSDPTTNNPSLFPSAQPSKSPTTQSPITNAPITSNPSQSPTKTPTNITSFNPTQTPAYNQSQSPMSKSPTYIPSKFPVYNPSQSPMTNVLPTFNTTKSPTHVPSKSPASQPIIISPITTLVIDSLSPTISPTQSPQISGITPTVSPKNELFIESTPFYILLGCLIVIIICFIGIIYIAKRKKRIRRLENKEKMNENIGSRQIEGIGTTNMIETQRVNSNSSIQLTNINTTDINNNYNIYTTPIQSFQTANNGDLGLSDFNLEGDNEDESDDGMYTNHANNHITKGGDNVITRGNDDGNNYKQTPNGDFQTKR